MNKSVRVSERTHKILIKNKEMYGIPIGFQIEVAVRNLMETFPGRSFSILKSLTKFIDLLAGE